MKTTLNVNIDQRAFTMNTDAYEMLKRYLDDLSSRFEPSEAAETVADFESRIADLFNSQLTSPRQVVTTDMVRHAISVLGQADEFGSPHRDNNTAANTAAPVQPRRLRRSRRYKILGGVCGGIAEYFNIDVTIVRVLALLLLISAGTGLLLYIIMWIVVPLEPLKLFQ